MKWPDKDSREAFEIAGFIESYARLPGLPRLSIVCAGDEPDFIVREAVTGDEFGVELTSVYLDNFSVPQVHMCDGALGERLIEIPYDQQEIEKYKSRLISAIQEKIDKARRGYDHSRPLILAIYLNEYIGIYLKKSDLEDLVSHHESLFDSMAPFSEIVFWSLPDGRVFRVRPGNSDAQ